SALSTSAVHARAATGLLHADDVVALDACTLERADTLSAAALLALVPARRHRVLRAWITSLGLPPLPSPGLARIDDDLLHARADAQPRFDWHDASVRAWRGRLHASRRGPILHRSVEIAWDGLAPVRLPDGGQLMIEPPLALPPTVRVRARRGGERIRLPGRQHGHALKHVLQDLEVPPWTREHLPLLVDGDDVLAAGDVVVCASLTACLETAGARLEWIRPEGA
ncbi:tRNA lysidine(34) synthetase TilS, partial [Cognatilysobacter lacus]